MFSKQYFARSLLRRLPLCGAVTLAMVLLNILFYGFWGGVDAAKGINADTLAGAALFLMVPAGVLLSLSFYSFLWKKTEDGGYGQLNENRFSMLSTSMLAGAVLISAMLLVNLLTMVVIVKVLYPTAACAVQAFFFSYFAMLGGFLAVFAAAALAATLSHGLLPCLMLTALILWLPTALAVIIQTPLLPYVGEVSTATDGILHLNTVGADGIFLFPSFYSISGNELSVSRILSFSVGLTNVGQIVYNYILWACFTVLGAFLLRWRSAKTFGYAYGREIFTDCVLFLCFFPLAFASIYFSGSRLIFFVLLVALFFAFAILLRRGLNNVFRSFITCCACFIAAGLVFLITSNVTSGIEAYENYNVSQVLKIHVYAAPADLACTSDTDTALVAISDKDAIENILQATPRSLNDDLSLPHKNQKITVFLDNGKAYTSYYMLTSQAAKALYDYIDASPAYKEAISSFLSYPVQAAQLCTDGVEASPIAISDALAVCEIADNEPLYERYIATYEAAEKYSYALAAEYSGFDFSNLLPYYSDKTSRAVITYRYINGKYYISARETVFVPEN